MSNPRPQEVITKLMQLLRNNITDLNKERKNRGGQWIWDDFPRLDATTPRIGIQLVTSPWQSGGVGNQKIIKCRIQITVMMRVKEKYDIDGDGAAEHTEDCIDYLANEVLDVIHRNNDEFKTIDGVIHVTPLGQPRAIRNANNIFRYIDVEAEMERIV